MDKNQKIAVAVIVVIALIAAWQLGKKPGADQNENQNQEQVKADNSGKKPTPSPTPTSSKNGGATATPTDGTWEGKLEATDNAAKGNYKLVTSDHVIYIRTSRDYSTLVGKNVKVSYEGTLESFSLGDITAK